MNTTNRILLIAVVVLFCALLGVVGWRQWFAVRPYYAVYLRTGDLYFGTLTQFPSFGLRNVYMLQVNRDDPQNPVSIQKFANVFWGPEDVMKINRDEVVWTAPLSNDGQLAELLRTNPNLSSSRNQDQGTQNVFQGNTQLLNENNVSNGTSQVEKQGKQ